MDAAIQRAVLAAGRRLAEGRPVNIADGAFWRQHGMPDISVRQDVLARASALEHGSQSAIMGDWFGTVSSLFDGTGFPAGSGGGGPVDTDDARVHIRFSFEDQFGNVVYRSWSGVYDWGTDLSEIYSDLTDAIDNMERGYGLSGGMLVAESLIIY